MKSLNELIDFLRDQERQITTAEDGSAISGYIVPSSLLAENLKKTKAAIQAYRAELQAVKEDIEALEDCGESEHYEDGYDNGVADAAQMLGKFIEGESEEGGNNA